ncbi:lytic murein transglycosylase [Patescibacteria group bacterium]|nr:lytic murein transglycosylase [Patescibacteria group bacterium]
MLLFKRCALLLVLCGVLVVPVFSVFALSPAEERALLERELEELEKEIAGYEDNIASTRAKKQTLQNQIAIIEDSIKKLNLQIYRSNALVVDLKGQITDTTLSIDQTEQNVGRTKEQLGELLQLLYEEDQKAPVEIFFSGSDLSEFFDNLAGLEALNIRNRELLENLVELEEYLQSQKVKLQDEKTEQENFARIQILQRSEVQTTQREKEDLLTTTKGEEGRYQQILSDRLKKAQGIRSRIFELIGVPEAPTFGEALEIAKAVSGQTGVRPALLLAVLTQESNIGKNVGQCFLKDPKTAAGAYINTGVAVSKVMKPMGLSGRKGDVQDFLRITQALGRDPFNTPVSCPIPSVGGYGGAMGPAQFIPTTWALYEARLQSILGRPGDPWNIKDAFLASGLLLADNGATPQTYIAEWQAAMRYFSGSTNPRYRFYGDSVMAIAARYEQDIKALEGN